MSDTMMRFLHRVIIFSLVALLIMVTYFAGIHHQVRHWYRKDVKKRLKKDGSKVRVSHTLRDKQIDLEREWQDFYHLSKKAKDKSSFKNFSLTSGYVKKPRTYLLDVEDEETAKNVKVDPTRIIKLPKTKKKDQCIILIYTYLHKAREWYNLPFNSTKNYLKRTKCKYKNCIVTYDKDYLHLADAVIFHARNIPSTELLNVISKKSYRPKNQRWIYFTSETPKNSAFGAIPFDGLFNWTMTYKASSDIFLPYLQYRKLRKKDRRPDISKNYAATKSRIAAWLVGNCNFEFRLDFAHLLSQHTDVYVGGGCRDEFKKKIECTRWCDLSALEPYKFYLSFENGICTDYITEKYWRYLEMGMVPVVLSGANYDNPKLAIPGSYIDATKFKSIKELGQYLNYLDKNDTAYNEYFKWKQKYKIWHPPKGDWPFESYFLCKICGMLNKNLPNKVYNHLSEFWNEYNDCEVPERNLRSKFIPRDFSSESRERDAEEERKEKNARISKDFDEE